MRVRVGEKKFERVKLVTFDPEERWEIGDGYADDVNESLLVLSFEDGTTENVYGMRERISIEEEK